MKCPADGKDLVMSERQGVEIDYCPECRGVWLDRSELDKIIDRSAGGGVAARGDTYNQAGHDDKHGRRKRGFLGDLFD